MLGDALGWFEKKLSDSQKQTNDYIEKMKQMTKETKNFIAIQEILTEKGSLSSGMAGMGALGNLTGGMDSSDSIQMIDDIVSGYEEFNKVLDENTKIQEYNQKQVMENSKRRHKRAVHQKDEIQLSERLTDSQEQSIKMFDRMATGYRNIRDNTGVTSKATEAYILAVRGVVSVTKEQLLELKKLSETELLLIGNQQKLKAEASAANDQFKQSFHPLSQYQKQIKTITAAIENQTLALAAQNDVNSIASALMRVEIARMKKQIALIKQVDEARHSSERAAMAFKIEEAKLDKNLTENAKKQALQSIKKRKLEREIAEAQQVQAQIGIKLSPLGEFYTASETQALQRAEDRIALSEVQLANLEIESVKTKALGDVQNALSDAKKEQLVEIASLEKGLLEVNKRSLSQQKESLTLFEKEQALKLKEMGRSRKRSGGLFSKFGDEKAAAADALKLAQDQLVAKRNFIEDEFDLKLKTIAAEYKLLEAKRHIAELEAAAKGVELQNDGNPLTNAAGKAYEALAAQLALQKGVLTEQRTMAETLAFRGRNLSISQLTSSLEDLRDTNDDLQDMKSLVDNIEDSVANNMTSAFVGLVDGTKSFKQAFGQMATAILADITQMIIRMMVVRALMAAFGGGQAPITPDNQSPSSSLGNYANYARYGSKSPEYMRSGGMPKYATGGIARGSQAGYPAVLHGTEAVIPMPHGSIPVDLGKNAGGGTQVNNITVNVSSDGSTSTEGAGGGQDITQLGSLIASAVQDELTNQKRAGGILSPYGSA